MKRMNQKGFTALEIVLLVVVLGLAAASGFYVMSQSKDKTVDDQTSTSETDKQLAAKPTSCDLDDKTKKGSYAEVGGAKGYLLCLPLGWNLNYTDTTDFYYAGSLEDMTYDESKASMFNKVGGSDGSRPLFVGYAKELSKDRKDQLVQYEKITAPVSVNQNTTVAAYYHLTTKNDPIGAGIDYLPEGTKQYVFVVSSKTANAGVMIVDYSQQPGEPDLLSFIQDISAASVSNKDVQ